MSFWEITTGVFARVVLVLAARLFPVKLFVRFIFVTRFVFISGLFAKILMFSFCVMLVGCSTLLSFFVGCGFGPGRVVSFGVAYKEVCFSGSFVLAPVALDLVGEL